MIFNAQQLFHFFLFGIFLTSCHNDQNSQLFTIPHVLNSSLPDSVKSEKYKSDHILQSRLIYAGKFKFNDVIDINEELRDSNYYKDHLDSYQYRELEDPIDLNGFEIFTDYEQSIKYDIDEFKLGHVYDFYPIFLVNSTHRDKLFHGHNSTAYGIQMAAAEEKWDYLKPIEQIGYNHCGMGDFAITIHPREFIVLLAKKYAGNFKTTLQVRIKNQENTIVSHTFIGTIDKKQFLIKKDSRLQKRLLKSNGLAGVHLFCGAFFTDEYWK